MWFYDKKTQYPVKINSCNPKMAKYIITQYGGPDGELAASLRYLSQRFSMPTDEAKAILNDIGTEELAHLEMVGAMVHQLTKGVPAKELERLGLGAYYSDHDHAVYPVSASGSPFTAAYLQSKGDPIADLMEDLAAEQKARATYENLINLADDPDVIEPLRFLRQREIVHFQRFGEALRIVQDKLNEKNNFYMGNMPNLSNCVPKTASMPASTGKSNTLPASKDKQNISPANTAELPSFTGKSNTLPASAGKPNILPSNTAEMPASTDKSGTLPASTGKPNTSPTTTAEMPASTDKSSTLPASTGKPNNVSDIASKPMNKPNRFY